MDDNEKSLTYFIPNPTEGGPGLSTPEFRIRHTIATLTPEEREQVERTCRDLGCTMETWAEANVTVMMERKDEMRELLSLHEQGTMPLLELNDYVAGLIAEHIRTGQKLR